MSEICTILCSDYRCRYNTGGGGYGVCRHPYIKSILVYCGIDRIYRSTCRMSEPVFIPNKVEHKTHPELLSGTWGGTKEDSDND